MTAPNASRRRRAARAAGCACLLAVAAACTAPPPYVPPQVDVPASFDGYAQLPQTMLDDALASPAMRSTWWQGYGSPELTELIEEALINNRELRQAVQRIAQAHAEAGIEAGPLLPELGIAGEAAHDDPGGGPGTFTGANSDLEHSYQLGLEASYEVDLWGKNRAAAQAALAAAQASIYDREAVAMTLTGDIAASYVTYLALLDRLKVARNNVRNMEDVLELVQKRIDTGEGMRMELDQQRALLAEAKADVPVIELEIARTRHALAVLVGRPPQDFRLRGTGLADLDVPVIHPGLPSELLLRRPDLRRAEAQLLAANADIGVARAALFPSLTLTAEYGVGSNHLADITSPAAVFVALAADLAQSVFDNGARAAEIAFNEAGYEALVQAYHQSVLTALREVEDSLAGLRLSHEELEARRAAEEFATKAHGLSDRSFRAGLVDYLRVLEAERTKFRSADLEVQAHQDVLLSSVALFRALGGGFEPVVAGRLGEMQQ